MIRVNLIGTPKAAPEAVKRQRESGPSPVLPLLWAVVLLGTALYGYLWYSGLTERSAALTDQIGATQAQLAQLQQAIEADAVFEVRKAQLETRIGVIERLQQNQVSPVLSLDMLGDAIDNTQYVWLTQLTQNNTSFSLVGVGTSVNAIADFITNLERTGYFRNINLVNAQDANGNFSFSMTCQFVPPLPQGADAVSGVVSGEMGVVETVANND